MTSTVPCPECHQLAHVLDSFAVPRASSVDDTVRSLRVSCDGPLSFLVAVDDVGGDPVGPAALDVHDGAA
jgi:hypothetical protein